ncbi:MAG: YceI family protein [Acidimicrobiia bacterium]|nr:YceI family protein [Acidimicrobiia bacterium]
MEQERGGILLRLVLLAAVVVVAGGAALYWFVIRSDSPPRFELSESPSTTAAGGTGADGAEPGGAETDGADSASGADGTWVVLTAPRADGSVSEVGYRIGEQFARLPTPSEAVGRTPGVEGSLTIAGSTVEAVDVTADLSLLKSDKDRRDETLQTRGLETDTFPTASFVLTEPIDLGAPPEQGQAVTAVATGDLTLHGVTRPVEIPLDARWDGDAIEVVGQVDVALADFSIDPPDVAGMLTVENTGELELRLFFGRSTA